MANSSASMISANHILTVYTTHCIWLVSKINT